MSSGATGTSFSRSAQRDAYAYSLNTAPCKRNAALCPMQRKHRSGRAASGRSLRDARLHGLAALRGARDWDDAAVPSIADQVETLELINKEVSERYVRLTAAGTQLDTKAALLAGVAATATQFLASRPAPQPVLASIAFAAFALAFLAALGAYAVTRRQDVPDPDTLLTLVDKSKPHVLARLAATRTAAFNNNHRIHRRKARLWWCSVAVLTVGLIFSTLAIVHNVSS